MDKPIIIVINGLAQSGKDEFVKFCRREFELENGEDFCVNYHRSDKPKELLKQLGWNGEKNLAARTALKYMVDVYEESVGTVAVLENKIEVFMQACGKYPIIFVHIRDTEIIERVMQHFKDTAHVYSVLIIRKDWVFLSPEKDFWEVGKYAYTDYIRNYGDLDILRGLAQSFIKKVCAEVREVEKQEAKNGYK